MYYTTNLVLFLNKGMQSKRTSLNNTGTDMKKVKQLAKEVYKADLDMMLIIAWFMHLLG